MDRSYWLVPKNVPELLDAMITALAGSSRLILEGNLREFDFTTVMRTNLESPDALVRRESPESPDLLVLPLELGTINPILTQLKASKHLKKNLVAVTIEKQGKIEFLAGDNFHHECISVGKAIPEELLQRLVAIGTIKGYRKA